MILSLLIGGFLSVLCVLIHSQATKYILLIAKNEKFRSRMAGKKHNKEIWVSFSVIVMIVVSTFESLIWAGAYLLIGAIEGFQKAAYFSLVTYTTLGYGDVTLHEDWHILASLEAALGIIIFGWTTAIVMLGIQSMYFKNK